MGIKTGILWTDATWNPWTGCKKVSAGCRNCYMFREAVRWGKDPNLIRRSKTTFGDPLKWPAPRKIFVCSWSDFFLREADPWRADAWDIIRRCPQHTFQLCTKRPERIEECLPKDWGDGYPNVWLGVTAEDQEMFFQRVRVLIHIPAAVHWISIEPMLTDVNVTEHGWWDFRYTYDFYPKGMFKPPIGWVVVGGESGDRTHPARPFDPNWARQVIRQCRAAEVPVFVKQMGSNPIGLQLKEKHGALMEEWPEDLRVREFPTL